MKRLSLDQLWRILAARGDISPELRCAAEAALERNARAPAILDLRGISDVTDFFMITTGDSDAHTRAICDNILDRTRERGFRPAGVEGIGSGRWVLIDYVGFVVHVFLREVREFYQLERLWGDAPVFEVE